MSKLAEMTQTFNDMLNKMRLEVKVYIKEETKEIFDRYPNAVIGFKTWIPSFNDGDPCEFTMGDVNVFAFNSSVDLSEIDCQEIIRNGEIDGDLLEQIEWANGEFYHDGYEHHREMVPEVVNEFAKNLSRLPDDLLETVFGANSLVVITQQGIEIDDYYCEY